MAHELEIDCSNGTERVIPLGAIEYREFLLYQEEISRPHLERAARENETRREKAELKQALSNHPDPLIAKLAKHI